MNLQNVGNYPPTNYTASNHIHILCTEHYTMAAIYTAVSQYHFHNHHIGTLTTSRSSYLYVPQFSSVHPENKLLQLSFLPPVN